MVVKLGAIGKEFATVATYGHKVVALGVPVLVSVPFKMQFKLCSVWAENGALRALDRHKVCVHGAIMLVKVRYTYVCCTAHLITYPGSGGVLVIYVTCDCMYVLIGGKAECAETLSGYLPIIPDDIIVKGWIQSVL